MPPPINLPATNTSHKWTDAQWGNLGSTLQGLTPIMNALLDNQYTNAYSRNLYVDRSTAATMMNPYMAAFGGTIEDLSDQEYAKVQALADQYGVDVNTMLDALNKQYYQGQDQQDDEAQQNPYGVMDQDQDDSGYGYSDDDEDNYATGGKTKKKKKHWIQGAINPKHKGYCTPMTKSTCTGRRRALALTFKKHHGFHKKKKAAAYGGIYATGGTYDLPQREINRLIKQGYQLEYL